MILAADDSRYFSFEGYIFLRFYMETCRYDAEVTEPRIKDFFPFPAR